MRFLVCLFFAAACISPSSAAASGSGPRLIEYEIDESAPTTLEGTWTRATAVVKARVIATVAKPRLIPGSSQPSVETEAKLHVSEVLKGELPLDATRQLLVSQLAGEVILPDATVRIRDVEVVRPGAEYVIFLGWNDYVKQWQITGSDGLYELREGKVRSLGRGAVALERQGRASEDFLKELRALKGRR